MTQPPFWQPAKTYSQLWRTALGTGLVAGFFLAFSLGLVFGGGWLIGQPDWMLGLPTSPAATSVYFLTFLGFHLGLALVLPVLHKRRYPSLFGPSHRLNGRHFFIGAGVTLALATGLYGLLGLEHLLLPEGLSPPVTKGLDVTTWAIWLVPALVLIFVQTLAEEALFRGYLLQQLRARFRSPLVWAFLPSITFGLLHYDPVTYGTINAAAYVLNATVLGTLAAFITLRTGNLAAAAGLHFGNNATLVAFGLDGTLDGYALFTLTLDLKSGYTTYSILTQTAVMALAFAFWWRWMNRNRPIANRADAA